MKMLGFRNFYEIPPSPVVAKLYNHPSNNNNKDKPSYRDTNEVITVPETGQTWFSTEYQQEAMQKMLNAFKNNDGVSNMDVAVTQGLNLNREELTPKNLKKILRNNKKGIYASYLTYNGGHAVVITGVEGNNLIVNDPNYKKSRKIPLKKFNPGILALVIEDKTIISPSVDKNSTNKYIGKINLEKSSNQAIFHHFDQARKDYTTNITEKDSKNTNKVVEDAADFMNFLVQVDEVVRPRYNMAIQKKINYPIPSTP
jgi:hypothetical protein